MSDTNNVIYAYLRKGQNDTAEEVIFDGTEESVLKIMELLPWGNKAIISRGKAITIPTGKGAKDVYMGDAVFEKEGIIYVRRRGE